VLVGAGVVWLCWQYRAQSNLPVLGTAGLKYSPGWVIGWWLIPVASYAMPYLTVRELYKASAPGAGAIDWAAVRTPPLLAFWWIAWVSRTILSLIGFSVAAGSQGSASQAAARQGWLIASDLVSVVAAALAVLIVREIDRRQEDKRGRQQAANGPAWAGSGTP